MGHGDTRVEHGYYRSEIDTLQPQNPFRVSPLIQALFACRRGYLWPCDHGRYEGGGVKAHAGEIQIQHTIGQGIGGSARGPDLELGSGYWPGVLRVAPPPRTNGSYLPMISYRCSFSSDQFTVCRHLFTVRGRP